MLIAPVCALGCFYDFIAAAAAGGDGGGGGPVSLLQFLRLILNSKQLISKLIDLGVLLNTLNLLQPTGHVMHQQFNIQQLYVLPALYLCVLYLSENKQRLLPLTA